MHMATRSRVPHRYFRNGIPAALVLTLAAILSAGGAPAQPVSCAKADKPAEFAICNSEDLRLLDEKLDAAMQNAAAALGDRPSRQELSRQQAQWEVSRNACEADISCLSQHYTDRLLELSADRRTGAVEPVANFKRFAGNGG